MEARLGITKCDKCGKPMNQGQPILVIAERSVAESGEELTFCGSCVRYACNLGCWDGIEKNGFAGRARNINIAAGGNIFCLCSTAGKGSDIVL